MQWVSTLSTRASLEAAVEEVVRQAKSALVGEADLAIVFISAAFASEYPRLMPLMQERLGDVPLVGCSGGGVIGTESDGNPIEIEDSPAISLTLASLPDVNLRTFHLAAEQFPDLDSSPNAWVDLIGVEPQEQPHFVLLADPFSSKMTDLLQGLDYAYPSAVKVGGLASTGSVNTNNGLFCDYQLHREGLVGVVLSGNIVVESIVAQGCRPIGQPYRVSEGERNIVLALEEPLESGSPVGGGALVSQKRTPLEVLQDVLQDLSEDDRELAQNSLFVGIAQNEFKLNLEPGDFLIRNLIGVDPRVGAIAIGDRIRPGQRIQFHLRDAQTSADDLEVLLRQYERQAIGKASPHGALMFACLGRGEGLYGEPNFDSQLFSTFVMNVPLSGFFCNGEIGPVGDSTFLHGYTSVFGIFRQP